MPVLNRAKYRERSNSTGRLEERIALLLRHDGVAENADLFDLNFDKIAGR